MIPEVGLLSLIFALMFSVLLSIIPLYGSFKQNSILMQSGHSLTAGLFVFVLIAYGFLTWAFYIDDFSVAYVASHSNSLLPMYYKLCAVWGGHEGSILFWVLTLVSWTLAVSLCSKNLPVEVTARVLSVMGMIAVGFLLFTLLTSNPFARILPNVPMDGADLNPQLQDPGFIIHPPMLYMGYVGFAVVFAFAIAALISGRFDQSWAKWSRPWTNVAWAFLTGGIALGSWWAYNELGWGGWWFWDPVENASFMPWLTGTALIHTLSMTEKRGVFKNWTLFLAIVTFCLSLLGTFLVRSGILNSVHAFASDPTRGVFILGFLGFVVGGSFILFALRAPLVKGESGFTLLSREAFLLANTLVFTVSAALVLLGTLYPLMTEALNMGKISVGEPWFNLFFTKMMALAALLSGLGIALNWKTSDVDHIKKWCVSPMVLSIVIGLLTPLLFQSLSDFEEYSIAAALTVFFAAWVILSTVFDMRHRSRHSGFIKGFKKFSRSYLGMVTSHIGFAIILMGAGLNTIYSDQQDVRLVYGEPLVAAGFEYELMKVESVRGANYNAQIADIVVRKNNRKDKSKEYRRLSPEKRQYFASGTITTEPSIDIGFFRDIYVAMGEKLTEEAWGVRIHYKPMIRWIWVGAIFMALGAILAVTDKRYRLKVRNNIKKPAKNNINEKNQQSAEQQRPKEIMTNI